MRPSLDGRSSDDLSVEELVLARRAIEIGEQLVRICDTMGQPEAGNHIVTGLEIMRVAVQLGELQFSSGLEEQFHSLGALLAETEKGSSSIDRIVGPVDEAAPL